jgi:hypothetical protein
MIQLPRRSVTRFFIPLIDVLTLLFCIFLLMPMVTPAEGTAGTPADAQKQRDAARHPSEGEQLTPELRRELQRLREDKMKVLEQRLLIRVLEIDPGSGKLYVNDPERIEIRNAEDARELIERDGRGRGADNREVYYLILFPRDRKSPYPLREQREKYEHWFNDVAHGWDVPGTGPARGGKL